MYVIVRHHTGRPPWWTPWFRGGREVRRYPAPCRVSTRTMPRGRSARGADGHHPRDGGKAESKRTAGGEWAPTGPGPPCASRGHEGRDRHRLVRRTPAGPRTARQRALPVAFSLFWGHPRHSAGSCPFRDVTLLAWGHNRWREEARSWNGSPQSVMR
jgi:hypothetical protein